MPLTKTKPCSCGGELTATTTTPMESATLRQLDRQPPVIPGQHAMVLATKVMSAISSRIYRCQKRGRVSIGW